MANTNYTSQRFSEGGAGDAVNNEGVPPGSLWVHAVNGGVAFVGTADIEVSIDGANWFESSVSPVAAAEYKEIPELCRFVRINISAYTSGELIVAFGHYTPQ